MDFSGYVRDAERVYESEKRKHDKLLEGQRLVISLVGNVNAGKSLTINAITGTRYADVQSIAGWTKHVGLYELPGFPGVFIADTPGLEDVNEEVSSRTEEFVERDSDVILFFINASVGVTRTEREAFMRLSASGRPVIAVVNKIDVLDDEERPVLLEDVRQKLALPSASSVHPISAKKGQGISELTTEIAELLRASGKDLLFAKVVRDKDRIVDTWIAGTAAAAFGLGVIPIPGSDTVPLTALQVGLCIKIADAYGIRVTRKDVLPLITEIAAGQIGKAIFRTALKGAGWLLGPIGAEVAAVVAGVVAGGMTYGLGKAAKAYYRSGMSRSFGELQEVFRRGADEYKRFKGYPEVEK